MNRSVLNQGGVMATTQKYDGEAIRRPLSSASQAVGTGCALAISCFISYTVITHLLTRAHFMSRGDDLLGGMWAVAATIFVYRESYQQSVIAALSRMATTMATRHPRDSSSRQFFILYILWM